MNWYLSVVKNHYADFKGRARRKEFWMFFLVNMIVGVICGLFKIPWISWIYELAILVPSLAVGVRRLHDIGKSGWWILGIFVPLLNLYLLYLLCCDSEKGLNAWGPSPKVAR